MATDPVCGMFVDERTATLTLVRENRTFYFCAASCLAEFADPDRHRTRLIRRLAVAWPLSLAVLALTYGPSIRDGGVLTAALAAVVQAYAGQGFYVGLRDAVRGRIWNMDVLVAIATTAAFAYSVAVLAWPDRLPPSLYFDASSLIVTLILTGNFLEQTTRRRSLGARRRLAELLPRTVRVVTAAGERSTSLAEIEPGAIVRVGPGERIPVDGRVRTGRSSVDESWIAGESRPLPKAAGDPVVAGSVNLDGTLELEARATGEATYLAEVGRLLAEAELSEAPLRKTADRIAEWFVPSVLAIAIVAAAGWYASGVGGPIALLVFVTVAITACPCAFGIATPAALARAVGQASAHGILFRTRDALERAADIDIVVADKTGTLSVGRPALAEVVPAEGRQPDEVLALAAGVEGLSPHPFASAVRAAAAARGAAPAAVDQPQVEPGVGAAGQWQGRRAEVRRPLPGEPAGWSASLRAASERFEGNGWGWSVVALDGQPLGLVAFEDPLAASGPSTVAALRARGVAVVLATGDGSGAARAAATALGISQWRARMSPAAKLEWVRELQRAGHRVAFVGDGVNDAPALVGADLGVAVGGGTDVAQEAGRVVLVRAGFEAIPAVVETGRRALRKVRQNLTWAIAYNAVLLPVAAGALVPWFGLHVYAVLPILGALAMGVSSTTVVLNSLTLRVAAPPAGGIPASGAAAAPG